MMGAYSFPKGSILNLIADYREMMVPILFSLLISLVRDYEIISYLPQRSRMMPRMLMLPHNDRLGISR